MISSRIRQLRHSLQLSQTEFGRQLGVSRDVIGNIEYGRVLPKEVFLQHMCKIYHVNQAWLMEGEGEMFARLLNIDKELEEAVELFHSLDPKLRRYALNQIKGLLEVQNADKIK